VIDAERGGMILKLAMPIGDAHRTNVVAFGQEKLDDHFSIFEQFRGVRMDAHAFGRSRDTRGLQLGRPFDFDKAEPAGAHIGDAVEMT
jgi:hypothetical protein